MSKEQKDLKDSRVMIVDDLPENRRVLYDLLEPEGYKISMAANGKDALRIVTEAPPDLILLDILMKEIDGYEVCRRLKRNDKTAHIPVIFITAFRKEDADVIEGFRAGGMDYITKPFKDEEVLLRVRTHLEINRLRKELTEQNDQLRQEIAKREAADRERNQAERERNEAEEALQKADKQLESLSEQEAKRWGIEGFVGQSQTIRKILDDVHSLQAVGTTSVLITGESGTGKELIARAIHFGGTRQKRPFVPVNCSAIPDELAESALFGHTQGAYTDAKTREKGYFELADGGTLFLDEIGNMSIGLQGKLLRVLEDGFYTPVGSVQRKRADVRILAATNADIEAKIAERTFRDDLYFRLARFPIHISPLRERKEDIPLLVSHFLSLFSAEMGMDAPALSDETLTALETYHFPGNIRELKNMIESALIKSGGAIIRPEHLHFLATIDANPPTTEATPAHPTADTKSHRSQVEEERILDYVGQSESISNGECRDLLNVDANRASYLLNKMATAGLLTRRGLHRWARYILS